MAQNTSISYYNSNDFIINGKNGGNSISLRIDYTDWPMQAAFGGDGPNGEQYYINIVIRVRRSDNSIISTQTNLIWFYTSSAKSGTYYINNWNIDAVNNSFTNGESLSISCDTTPTDTLYLTVVPVTLDFGIYASPATKETKYNQSAILPYATNVPDYYNDPSQWTTNEVDFAENYPFLPSAWLWATEYIIFTPKLTLKTYNITLDANGGSGGSLSSTTYQRSTSSQAITITPPTRSGYNLTGWTISQPGVGSVSISGNILTINGSSYGNFTITATWASSNFDKSYNVYKTEGNSTISGLITSYIARESTETTDAFTASANNGYDLSALNVTRGTPNGGPAPSVYGSYGNYTLTIPAGSYGDLTVVAETALIPYGITYVLNGGSVSGNPTYYYVTSNTITLNNPTRSGYNFAGWLPTNTIPQGSIGDKTFTATWTEQSYSISYSLGGSSAYPITNSSHGNPTSFTVSNLPITFSVGSLARAGWSNPSFSPSSISTTGDKSISVSWSSITYTLTANNNGGSGMSFSSSTYTSSNNNGSSITRTITAPSRAGYTLSGYSITRTGTYGGSTPTVSGSTITIPSGSYGNFTVNASWSGLTGNVITFSGASISSQNWTTSSSSQQKTFTIPTKTGYRINTVTITTQSQGSNSSVSYTGYDGTITIPANAYGSIVVTITYVANTYTLAFDSQGGSAVNSTAETYDVEIGTLETPTLTGYNFNGWFTASTGGTQVTSTSKNLTSVHEATVTLYAQWSPKTLTIVYNSGTGTGTMTNSTGLYNGYVLVKTNAFIKTGYTFTGWLNSDTGADITEPTQNTSYSVPELSSVIGTTSEAGVSITLTAQWTINQYTVTFNSNGGSLVNSITQNYNTSVSQPANPTFTGYTFGGWFTDVGLTTLRTWPFNMPASNTTLYAKWIGQPYTITINNNGGTGETNKNYTTSPNSQDILLKVAPDMTKPATIDKVYSFAYWEIITNTTGGTSTIVDGNKLRIPGNAYGAITLKARWNEAASAIYVGSNRIGADQFKISENTIDKIVLINDNEEEVVVFEQSFSLEE